MSDAVRLERREAVLEITLDRPKANAIDAATSRRLGAAFRDFRADPELRVAIVTGAGERFFSAGWDLKAAAGGEAIDSDFGPSGFAGLLELLDLDKPVIAAVNGLAVGGGFELALGADLIVAAEHAEFFLPEVAVGVVADAASFRLPHRIPRAIAMELLFTGRRMGAGEAAHRGLVNAAVPAAELMDQARALAGQMVAGAPLSLAAVKELVRYRESHSLEQCHAASRSGELKGYQRMLDSEDAREGPKAFAEKRAPVWRGR
jgi:crotonobetainyl-CoA hydratase